MYERYKEFSAALSVKLQFNLNSCASITYFETYPEKTEKLIFNLSRAISFVHNLIQHPPISPEFFIWHTGTQCV